MWQQHPPRCPRRPLPRNSSSMSGSPKMTNRLPLQVFFKSRVTCTVPLAVACRDVGPAAAFLRGAIWLYLGDALQNKVPISLLGPVCHALCSSGQTGGDVAAFFEHCGDLCFFHAPRPGVEQRILQGFVRGARDVGVTQASCGGSEPTP